MKLLRLIPLLLSIGVTFLVAQDSFLDMGATIPGESTTKGFEHQIQVLGFTYDGSVLQKVTGFNTMIFSKKFDSASPKILEAAVRGTRLPEVTLTLTKSSNGVMLSYARVVMKDAIVTGVAIASDDEGPVEKMTLQYGSAEWCERPQLGNGTLGPEGCVTIVTK